MTVNDTSANLDITIFMLINSLFGVGCCCNKIFSFRGDSSSNLLFFCFCQSLSFEARFSLSWIGQM